MKVKGIILFLVIALFLSIPLVTMFANYSPGMVKTDMVDFSTDRQDIVSYNESGVKIIVYLIFEFIVLFVLSTSFFDWGDILVKIKKR